MKKNEKAPDISQVFQTVNKLDKKSSLFTVFFVWRRNGFVDYLCRRFAFFGRIMKKPNCRLLHKQILLGAGAEPP